MDWSTLNPEVIAEFRANAGKVARFGDLAVIILHTIGAKTGRTLEVPLLVVPRDDDILIYGTAAGAKSHPSWYYNLQAHPEIDVELGAERFGARIEQLADSEAEQLLTAHAEANTQLQQYLQDAAPRRVPVFRVDRI